MAWWVAAAAIGGAIAKNEADRKAARAQRKSLELSAKDRLKAADSVIYANTINRSLAEIKGRQVQAAQVAAYASSGVDISSGSVLATTAATETQMLRNDFLSKQKANAQADLIKAQADQDIMQGNLAEENSRNRQVQNIIGAGLQAATALDT